ncbi:MAG: transcription termination factor Rho [Coriobacteriales bacterium]|nr:transcription termination factor Rho [Coriobacteriales bacterium]
MAEELENTPVEPIQASLEFDEPEQVVEAEPPRQKRKRRSPKREKDGEEAEREERPESEPANEQVDAAPSVPEAAEPAQGETSERPAESAQESEQAEEGAPSEAQQEAGQEQQGDQQGDQQGQRKRRRQQGQNGSNNAQGRNKGANNRDNNRGQGGAQQGRRRNRRNNQGDHTAEPTLKREDLEHLKVAELRQKAAEYEIDYAGIRKAELIDIVYQAAAKAEGFKPIEGILDIQNEGYGFLRTGNYMKGDGDAFVHQQIVRQYNLRPGDKIRGTLTPSRAGNKYPPLGKVETINGLPPEQVRKRPRFRDLTPVFPNERLVMEHGRDSITGRAIDLVAPIGKGQRGLIVSPPKAGKTTVLKRICQSIAANNPEVHLFCLLVDERPEEVTDMERSIKGEVVASTFDMPADNHTAVSELVIEHAKRLVEQGEDVVVVLDSITRLARAYNLAQPASGRILSGGVDSAALYPPKRFLGAARNIEGGGSLTILASALVDTGSKMDEVIFEEFKGTGNMELKLDRELADKRIFPAIDPIASGTRNEELLIENDLQPFVWGIRRVLANMNNIERAESALVKGLKQTENNQEFLIRSAKKAQQTDYL